MATLIVVVTSFVVTNLDGFGLLALLFAVDLPADRRQAVAASAAGFAIVLVVSLAAAMMAHDIAPGWTRWLGVPLIAVGIVRGVLWLRARDRVEGAVETTTSVLTAVLATGGDNVVVYTGLFANLAPLAMALTSVAYLLAFTGVTVALLALAATGRRKRLLPVHWEPVAAVALIAIGVLITAKAFG